MGNEIKCGACGGRLHYSGPECQVCYGRGYVVVPERRPLASDAGTDEGYERNLRKAER